MATLACRIEECSRLLQQALDAQQQGAALAAEVEAAAAAARDGTVRERAWLYQAEQRLLAAKQTQPEAPPAPDDAPWRNHWLLGRPIEKPPLSALAQAVPAGGQQAAAEAGLPDFVYASKCLLEDNYCVIDGFYPLDACRRVWREIDDLYAQDGMAPGQLGGGAGDKARAGSTTLRSDFVCWKEGGDPGVEACTEYMVNRADVFVQKIAAFLDAAVGAPHGWEAKRRTKMMPAVYPGNGSHYVKHYDNPGTNTRKLTIVLYLNEGWRPEDGGYIRLGKPWQAQETDSLFTPIAPLMGRAVLFWSDKRCPHEVSPVYKTRYALTVWYLDEKDKSPEEADMR
ncbi:Hypoxia-inducible factor prolyl hydroxylase [Diplonema papillatum]|nr:Hypoxia-inducible factor prolyl hydroxylase [Diplonema papillatum]